MTHELSREQELIARADSMLSYLWYRGFINKPRLAQDTTGLEQDLKQLLIDLRVGH